MSHASLSNRHYVVTTLSKNKDKVLRSEVWDTTHPLSLGHPIRWILEGTAQGVRVRDLGAIFNQVQKVETNEVTYQELENSETFISISQIKLKFHPVHVFSETKNNPKATAWTPLLISNEAIHEEQFDRIFKKSLQGSILVLSILILISLVWPQKKSDDEVIPPQFAKVLLSPAFKKSDAATGSPQSGSAGRKENNVVQAFKSQAVQKSAKKLISGGALALLAQSNLLSGSASKKNINQIFDSKSKLDPSTLPNSANVQPNSVTVATLGGNSSSGVGYGSGAKAGVTGQGSSFVSLDSREAVVEEGLSLDDVGKVIHAHLNEVRYCYESSMLRHPGIEGKMIVDFRIQSSGIVKTAAVKSSTLTDSALEQCIVSHLMKWLFPKPKGGVEVAVSYPFVFKTLGK
jgi:outer membrane biosynthesis protein TonB